MVTVKGSRGAIESCCKIAHGWKLVPMVRRPRLNNILSIFEQNCSYIWQTNPNGKKTLSSLLTSQTQRAKKKQRQNFTWNGQKVTISLIPLSANLEKIGEIMIFNWKMFFADIDCALTCRPSAPGRANTVGQNSNRPGFFSHPNLYS